MRIQLLLFHCYCTFIAKKNPHCEYLIDFEVDPFKNEFISNFCIVHFLHSFFQLHVLVSFVLIMGKHLKPMQPISACVSFFIHSFESLTCMDFQAAQCNPQLINVLVVFVASANIWLHVASLQVISTSYLRPEGLIEHGHHAENVMD